MTLIPDLEEKLVRAAERAATTRAADTRPAARRPALRGRWRMAGNAAAALLVGLTLVIAGGAIVLLRAHHSVPRARAAAGGRSGLVTALAVLQRPQTAADRAFHATGWPAPPAASGTRAVLDRSLIRLATTTPDGAKVFIVPLTLVSPRGTTEVVAIWAQGVGWSALWTPSDIERGAAWGPLKATGANGRLRSEFFEIVPNRVEKVVFYNLSRTPPVRLDGSIAAHVRGNVARFVDSGGARDVVASWYGSSGQLIKRVGNPRLLGLKASPPPRAHGQAAVQVARADRYCTSSRGETLELCPVSRRGLIRLGGPSSQWLVIFSFTAPRTTRASGRTVLLLHRGRAAGLSQRESVRRLQPGSQSRSAGRGLVRLRPALPRRGPRHRQSPHGAERPSFPGLRQRPDDRDLQFHYPPPRRVVTLSVPRMTLSELRSAQRARGARPKPPRPRP